MKPIPLSTVQKLSLTFFLIGVILMVLGICTGTMVGLIILMVAGWIVLIGDIIFIVLFFRCPHCGEGLLKIRSNYCPHCGNYLR